MMFDLTILQKYAKRSPSSLPPTLLLTNSETSLTIFDKYPKATYHFLVLPRITADSEFTADELENLQTLLARGKKAEARVLIEGLKKDAQTAKEMVEKEMLKRHGYKWDVWIGFHAVPSLTCVWELRHTPTTISPDLVSLIGHLMHFDLPQPLTSARHLFGLVLAEFEAQETLQLVSPESGVLPPRRRSVSLVRAG
jgi:hypothetical protein